MSFETEKEKNSNNLNHVAFILDGNRRYAVKNNISKLLGHKMGKDKTFEIIKWCAEENILNVTFWFLSVRNLQRSADEVENLMSIIYEAINPDNVIIQFLHKNNYRVEFIGEHHYLQPWPHVLKAINDSRKLTAQNEKNKSIVLAIAYDGKSELLNVFKELAMEMNEATEEDISKHTYLGKIGLAPPELIVRTGGDRRTSDFLNWSNGYSIFYFTDKLLPEFDKSDLVDALDLYTKKRVSQ